MVFSSYIFVLMFLPISLLGYFIIQRFSKGNKASLGFIILMSLIFYGYNNPSYVFVLIGSILVNWFVSRLFYRAEESGKKWILFAGVLFDVGLIFYFKYYDFFIENMNKALHTSFVLKEIILPLGISFFTFQQISYLVDSYRGDTADYGFIEYAAFISFFPQLVAGPIVMHSELIPQFRNPANKKLIPENMVTGIQMFTLGLFKKVWIADILGKAVDWAFDNADGLSAGDIILITFAFTFQLYFDFSGYSDMAIGIGKMFNFSLPINFDSPYKAFSIREFWKRWHMTLTRFLTKYIYIPLGGNRKGTIRTYLNIMIVFLISGLWHGANMTFVLWGALHGMFLILERIGEKAYVKLHKGLQWLYSFGMVSVLFLLFRCDSISQWLSFLKRVLLFENLNINSEIFSRFFRAETRLLLTSEGIVARADMIYRMTTIATMIFCLALCLGFENNYRRKYTPTVVGMCLTAFLFAWVITYMGTETIFIYFNF